ncbi:hypothetical protein EYF80_023494 [Liparis tanakae]|uniref:Uncharacterized protein n=1 Tax=Liparis tanakae TaxID=230148 RepID=A0A4Z2HL41_9TELE|nr:hypothetical protein EYF80_023494 [Liparis tanakae]
MDAEVFIPQPTMMQLKNKDQTTEAHLDAAAMAMAMAMARPLLASVSPVREGVIPVTFRACRYKNQHSFGCILFPSDPNVGTTTTEVQCFLVLPDWGIKIMIFYGCSRRCDSDAAKGILNMLAFIHAHQSVDDKLQFESLEIALRVQSAAIKYFLAPITFSTCDARRCVTMR